MAMLKKICGLVTLFVTLTLACGGLGSQTRSSQAPPTKTPLPTFTVSPTLTLQPPIPTPLPPDTPTPVPLDTATLTPSPADISLNEAAPSETPTPLPSNTPVPVPPPATDTPVIEATPTETPTPEPIIKYVLAGTNREFNCNFTYIYGSVKNANNFGLADVEVRALGIHETTGLDFITRTDAGGNYEIFRIPLNDLLAAQWAVMLMENRQEVSDRFHWASTPVCESDDTGHSQVLRIDWKLIE